MRWRSGYKYQLAATDDYVTSFRPGKDIITDFIRLDQNGKMSVYKGYAWDGVTWFLDLLKLIRASLVHDALYQLMRENHLSPNDWRKADHMFKSYALADGVNPILVKLLMVVLKVANGRFAQPKLKKPIYTFP